MIADFTIMVSRKVLYFFASLFSILPEQIPAEANIIFTGLIALLLVSAIFRAVVAIIQRIFGFKPEVRR